MTTTTSPFGPTDNAFLEGNFAPYLKEEDYDSLDIIDGTLPPELEGRALVRVGPNPTYKPLNMKYYHWFDGDGMVNAFYFHKGRVSFKNRFVKTEKHSLETNAGKALFGGIRSTSATTFQGWFDIKFGLLNLMWMGLRVWLKMGPTQRQYQKISPVLNCANTNIVLQNGHLLALDEAGQPYQMQLDTLDTIGLYNYNDGLRGPCVAHPVTDPETGYTYTIGYTPEPPYMQFYTISPESKVVDYTPVYVPFPAMMHTLSLTRKYFVFFHMPATFFLKNMGQREPIRWQPELGWRVGIMPRDGLEPQPTWFELPPPPGWMFHCMNSYDDGDNVVCYVAKFPRIPLLDLHKSNPSPPFNEEPFAALVRWTLNTKTGAFTEDVINKNYVEFPLMDERFLMQRQKHGWSTALLHTDEKYGLWNTVWHYNFEAGTEEQFYCGEGNYIGECLFTPRSANAPEGEGFILTVMWNKDDHHSTLLIFDAQRVAQGPITRIRVPRRIEYDFHGNIVPMEASNFGMKIKPGAGLQTA